MSAPGVVTRPPKILYVEDDVASRVLMSRLLLNSGYEVVEAEDGLSGLQVARRERPDLVLIDINMPDLDGYEVATRLRSLPGLEHVPIVAVTANVMAGDRERAITAGCDGYISKPIDVDELPRQIRAYLNGRRDVVSAKQRQQYLEEHTAKLVKRLEENVIDLKEANRALSKLDKMKTDFVTLAAHELRTPITLVYGYARLLMHNDAVTGHPQAMQPVKDLAHRIFDAANRLNEVVNDILNISLIDADEMELDIRPVNLLNVVEFVLEELNPLKKGRQLTVETTGLDNLPHIPGDEGRLRQVFWNLISNAMKFTPDGGLIRVEASAVEGEVEVIVSDTGIGIDRQEQADIFKRFYVIEDTAYHSSSKTAYMGGGMGLGLTIAQGIVKAHKGRIWVESEGRDSGSGSRFHVMLPLEA
ncbi:MAG: response regulator [Anaerolineae bacterium]